MTAVCMIYGATGHTGRMIVDAALAQGLRPVIAGRNGEKVRELAGRRQLPFRDFLLTDPQGIAEALADVNVVLNAAGPAPAGAEALARACIAAGVHYLDTAADPVTLGRLCELDETARAAGVTVVAGAGFSPAAAETLALHLKRRLPQAVRMTIALATPARATAGLIRAGLQIALRPSRAMRRGRLKTMGRRRVRRFDFGRGPETCYALGWGDLAAVHQATGVRNVDFFVRARPDLLRLLRLSPALAALRAIPAMWARFDAFAAAHGRKSSGRPGRSRLVGFAFDPSGQRAASRVHLPDPYTVTAELAAAALARVMSGPARAGAFTPGRYLGADFLAALPGLHVDWEELELSAPGEVNVRIRRHGRSFPFSLLRRRRPPGTAAPPPEGASGPSTDEAVETLRAAARVGRGTGLRAIGQDAPGAEAKAGGEAGLRHTGTG